MSDRVAIGDLGLVGDTRTAALVDTTGRVMWMCLPHFDGEPVFASLLAGDAGGEFRAGPAGTADVLERRYRPGSTVLETTWKVGAGRVVLTEGMVADVIDGLFPTLCLVRRLDALDAPVRCSVLFDPRFGDGRSPPRSRTTESVLVCDRGGIALSLTNDAGLDIRPGHRLDIDVSPRRPVTLALTAAHRGPLTHVAPADGWQALIRDEARWRQWSSGIGYDGPFAAAVERSIITLRLLTYSPSGAPVAAVTTSLPEQLGGARNWDYRYAWPRDASIGISAFLGVGLVDEARAFLYWLLHSSRLTRPRLPPVLTLHGRPVPAEREIAWSGYAGSRPVRFGNDARNQHQLDTYGWVLDAMWLLADAGHRLYRETWRAGMAMADFVAAHWREPDAGIWEVRGPPAHHVHSKLMGWLALDRAIRIAETHRARPRRLARWKAERDAVAGDVMARGVDLQQRTFVRSYGHTDLDAALLILPTLGFEPPDSALVTGTVDAVRRELTASGPLVYRYLPSRDDLVGGEGAFLPCSFWLVQALASTGDVDTATSLFEQLLAISGSLGLYSEEADPATGQQLGNFPQALTHAALVRAALALQGPRTRPTTGPTRHRTPREPPA